MFPESAFLISFALGFGDFFKRAVSTTTNPGVQNPHWIPPPFTNSLCSFESSSPREIPSIVDTSQPSVAAAE